MAYTVEVRPAARRAFLRLPKDLQEALAAHLRELEQDPRPHGCGPVKLRPGHLRLRVRHYRIIYRVDDAERLVIVTEFMPRREDYRSR